MELFIGIELCLVSFHPIVYHRFMLHAAAMLNGPRWDFVELFDFFLKSLFQVSIQFSVPHCLVRLFCATFSICFFYWFVLWTHRHIQIHCTLCKMYYDDKLCQVIIRESIGNDCWTDDIAVLYGNIIKIKNNNNNNSIIKSRTACIGIRKKTKSKMLKLFHSSFKNINEGNKIVFELNLKEMDETPSNI